MPWSPWKHLCWPGTQNKRAHRLTLEGTETQVHRNRGKPPRHQPTEAKTRGKNGSSQHAKGDLRYRLGAGVGDAGQVRSVQGPLAMQPCVWDVVVMAVIIGTWGFYAME